MPGRLLIVPSLAQPHVDEVVVSDREASFARCSPPTLMQSAPRLVRHAAWFVPLIVQVVHALAIAPTYHVGSFDDDGNYLMAAHVLANGGWLTSTMPSGASVAANYLPGYPALLVPIVWLFGGSLVAPRVLSLICTAALYPLTWYWLGRRKVPAWARVAALMVMALSPVLATYATMVMAEAPFVLVLMLGLLAVDLWDMSGHARWGIAAVLLSAELVWLKEAGLGLVVGLGAWLLWRRRWPRALAVAAGSALSLVPALLARSAGGEPLLGERYSGEISAQRQGLSLLGHWLSQAATNIGSYASTALHQTLLAGPAPWQHVPIVHGLVLLVWWSVPVLCVLGAVSMYRARPGAGTWMVGAYLLETLVYPYNNQRRVVLVIPVVAAWYATGAVVLVRWTVRRWTVRARLVRPSGVVRSLRPARSSWCLLVVGVLALVGGLAPAVARFGDNYLFGPGQQSSVFAGSPAIGMLAQLGRPAAVIETDYRGSVAYFTGHRTAWDAFTQTTPYGPTASKHRGSCTVSHVAPLLRDDNASFLLVGDLNIPGLDDSPCLLSMATSVTKAPVIGAVCLLSVPLDNASVFELLGPGSAQPQLRDLSRHTPVTVVGRPAKSVRLAPNGAGSAGTTAYSVPLSAGTASLAWRWSAPSDVDQLSVGSVTGQGGISISAVKVQVELPDGRWQRVAGAAGPVSQGGAAPYLLVNFSPGRRLSAVRVVVTATAAHAGTGTGTGAGRVQVAYVNAVGPAGNAVGPAGNAVGPAG
ncbi:MAG TPA: hypothetical protein VFN61_08540, partial [Acidimicrobiales bacterium]|nr:hypothetical protein [Acidimicrobiales bacterium]